MGKYNYFSQRQKSVPPPHRRGVHPVMRGIGCILMIVVPIFSYALAVVLVNYGLRQGWPLPIEWLGFPQLPPLLLRLSSVVALVNWLQGFPALTNNLIANLIFTIVLIILIGGMMSILYGYIYKLFGPPEYGPTDVPPVRVKVKRYKR